MDIRRFGNVVIEVVRKHLEPGEVVFLGSFASGRIDYYSDVDFRASVYRKLNQEFFDSLTVCLKNRFGSLSLRYDPDQKADKTAHTWRD